MSRLPVLVVPVLLATAVPQDHLDGLQWSAVLDVRAGALDGPGALGEVFHVDLSPTNQILVAQVTPPTISVFAADGRFVRDVGRVGEGPGEFRSLSRIGWADDTLWAMDFVGGRLHLFDSDLQFVRTITPNVTELPAGVDRVFPGPIMADGSLLGVPIAVLPADREPIVLFSEEGAMRRTVTTVSAQGRTVDVVLRSGSASNIGNPWPDAPLWMNAADGESIVVVERRSAQESSEATFRILRVALTGDTIVDRAISYSPRQLPQSAREEAIRSLAERLSRRVNVSGSISDIEQDVRRSLEAPAFRSPVTELITGRDGTIWLRREELTDLVDWQVFDAEGRELGTLRLPALLKVHGAELTQVWGVSRDALDVPFVEVHRVLRQ